MPRAASQSPAGRVPLSRERVLRGAVAVADAASLGAVTIRSIAHELGVKPMSLYHHVASKDDILDGMVDLVFQEIEPPSVAGDWRSELWRRCVAVRRVLRRHPWAIGLLDSRTNPGPATLDHHEAVLGTLRRGGFPVDLAAHAFALIDSYVYGFALQEASLPFDGSTTVADVAGPMAQRLPVKEYPYLVEMARDHILQPGYDFGDEFELGLRLILDALDRQVTQGRECSGSRDGIPSSASSVSVAAGNVAGPRHS